MCKSVRDFFQSLEDLTPTQAGFLCLGFSLAVISLTIALLLAFADKQTSPPLL